MKYFFTLFLPPALRYRIQVTSLHFDAFLPPRKIAVGGIKMILVIAKGNGKKRYKNERCCAAHLAFFMIMFCNAISLISSPIPLIVSCITEKVHLCSVDTKENKRHRTILGLLLIIIPIFQHPRLACLKAN